MPRKSKLTSSVAPKTEEEPITLPAIVPLSTEERRQLRELLATPLMKKVWANARCKKPTEFLGTEVLNSPHGYVAANNRLHEQRGWTMFETAILMQTFDPKPPKQKLSETYPDSGLPLAELNFKQT